MTRQKLKSFVGLLVISLLWFVIGWTVRGQWGATAGLSPEMTRVLRAGQLILARYYPGETISTDALANAAIRGMLRLTGDRYAALFVGAIHDRFEADLSGATGVPGLWYDQQGGQIVITGVRPGGPAEAAGLQAGDIIVAVDELSVDAYTSGEELALLMRGPIGEPTTIMVQRATEQLTFVVKRVPRQGISTQMLEGHIGYLHLPAFPAGGAEEMKTALQTLQKQGMDALIWDLRGNAGGSMRDTEAILNFFLTKGTLYTAEFKDGSRQSFAATGDAFLADLPLVVLTNKATYSAGEVVSATLLDHKRALLVGGATFGKGVIQDTMRLDDKSLLHLTIAKWLSPNGHWLQHKGVQPNVLLENDPATPTDEVLDYAVAHLQS